MRMSEVPRVVDESQSVQPDYLTSPDTVLYDKNVKWRYGRAPNYAKTRKAWKETRSVHHACTSLPESVENLVKNWEIEASFKPNLDDWRTINRPNYSFSINGGQAQPAEYMLKVGTYNALIAPNEFYCPMHHDFESSHKTFKRMMPTFAWEVIEVYSGPPLVAFKWRHWGVMKNDYVGLNNKGEKVAAKAHGEPIEIFGVTIAHVDNQIRLEKVETWFDPLEMFRQIVPTAGTTCDQIDPGTTRNPVGNSLTGMEIQLPIQAKPGQDVSIDGETTPDSTTTTKVPASEQSEPLNLSCVGVCPFGFGPTGVLGQMENEISTSNRISMAGGDHVDYSDIDQATGGGTTSRAESLIFVHQAETTDKNAKEFVKLEKPNSAEDHNTPVHSPESMGTVTNELTANITENAMPYAINEDIETQSDESDASTIYGGNCGSNNDIEIVKSALSSTMYQSNDQFKNLSEPSLFSRWMGTGRQSFPSDMLVGHCFE